MKKVFISGPYTHGDVEENVKNAMHAARQIIEMGAAPFCPHLFHFIHINKPAEYHIWMDIDFEFLKVCDCVYVLGGYSPGSEKEIAVARENNIPICKNFEELKEYISI